LAGGALEVLGTDLLDAQTYPAAEFQLGYGWRWHYETYQDRCKHIVEVERFSGKRGHAIKQDFSGVVFLATGESSVSKPAQAAVTAQGEARECRYAPQGNRAVSDVTGMDPVVQ
jgi:hypothetical protein